MGRKNQFIDEAFQLVQVSLSGYNRPYEKHGNKHIVTAPGYLLTYAGMEDEINETGQKLTENTLTIPLDSLPFAKDEVTVSCIYPKNEPVQYNVQNKDLTVCFEKPVTARLFEIK